MQVGDLIMNRYPPKGQHLGVVIEVGTEWMTGDVLVHWDDGDEDWVAKGNVEVINA